ncbi:MAG: superoxide dismutase [Firmicutes bacterium]|nr:superoxide dismutase [Bacillota bacterium]
MNNNNHYPFELMPLPYAYNALEPYIDEKTMRLHHDKHLGTYVNNLNDALKDYKELHNWTLEQLLYYSDRVPEKIRTAVLHNGGGVYNHNLFFANMSPEKPQSNAAGNLMRAIDQSFGGFDNFKTEFKNMALSVFGSGYTWLVLNDKCKLQILNTANQETVLPQNACPVMLIDVWEHAYYIKNYNVRANYIDNWFNVVNAAQAESNYNQCVKSMRCGC